MIAGIAAETADDSQMQVMLGQFYGNFYSWQNLLGFLIQLFWVSKIFKYIGIRGALFVLPCLALGSYALVKLVFVGIWLVIAVAIARHHKRPGTESELREAA